MSHVGRGKGRRWSQVSTEEETGGEERKKKKCWVWPQDSYYQIHPALKVSISLYNERNETEDQDLENARECKRARVESEKEKEHEDESTDGMTSLPDEILINFFKELSMR